MGVKKKTGSGDTPCKLWVGGIYSSYRRDACTNFRDGSFEWKLKVLVHFL